MRILFIVFQYLRRKPLFYLDTNIQLVLLSSTRRAIFMMNKTPVNVQQWVESVQTSTTGNMSSQIFNPTNSPSRRGTKIARDLSLQSDDASSHCSSVESVLELRRPDPEAVLIGLGFGPSVRTNTKSKIPLRFLMPSKVGKHSFIIILCQLLHTYYYLIDFCPLVTAPN